MNILELQDNLKDISDDVLMREMQMPSGNAPQFLILSELKRRKRMRDEFQRREAEDISTVAEETITAAGMPQQGIMQAARAIAPNTNMAQNTGMNMAAPVPATRAPQQPQMAADGGIVKMQTGGITEYPSINPLIGNVDLSQIAAMLQSGADKEALVANYGADAVREAESMLLPFMKKFIGQMPLGRYPSTLSRRDIRKMEDQGIFGNKSYRDIGGEGIGSVSADVEDFNASDTENIDAAQQISYQSGKEPFRRFGANYYDVMGPPEGKEMKGDRDRIMARAGQIFPTYLQKINEQINAPSSSVVASEPELSMDELMAQAQIEREGFGATVSPMSYDNLLKKAQSGLPITEDDLVQSVEAGLLNDQQAADINSIIDNPNYMPSQIEQDIANNPADLSFPDAPTNPNLLLPKVTDKVSDFVGGVFGGRTIAEQAKIDADRKRQAEEYDKYAQSGGFAGAVKGIEIPIGSTTEDQTTEDQMLEASGAADATYPATVFTDDDTTNVKSITDGGEDGAGFGSIDSRIAKMLADRQKEAEKEKYMALAYAGMELLKPTATLGEGLGKAGQAGLGYLTKAKKGLRDFETDMLKLQTTLDVARLRSQNKDKTSATAYAALERAYSDALTLATTDPTAPNLARLKELEAMINEARAAQFGTVIAGNTNSGVIKTPSAQTG